MDCDICGRPITTEDLTLCEACDGLFCPDCGSTEDGLCEECLADYEDY